MGEGERDGGKEEGRARGEDAKGMCERFNIIL